MPGEVEQLRYTWAPRGAEGVNRFQIAGISAGLKGGKAAGALSLARSLCRYDPPRGGTEERPVSYGWADQGRFRVAFHRMALPAGTDRTGNFAAHLLVGSPESLPAHQIVAAFGSPLWWRGITAEERAEIGDGKREFGLPTVAVEDFVSAAPEPDCAEEELIALLYHLLRLPAGERLVVAPGGEHLASILGVIGRLLPEVLAESTISTYEAKAVFPFRLMGGGGLATQAGVAELRLPESLGQDELRALQMLAGEGAASAELREVVRHAGRSAGSAAPERIWQTALLLVGLVGGTGSDVALDETLLADPEVAGFLARTAAGRRTIATWVQRGVGSILCGLKGAVQGMDEVRRDALYASLGDRFVAEGDLRGSAAAVAVMEDGRARQAVLDQLLEAAGDERVAATLGADDVVALLSRAEQRHLEAVAIRSLLSGSVAHLERCAEAAIPGTYLAAMFERALKSPGTLRLAARAIERRSTFLTVVSLDESSAGPCVETLRQVEPNTREVALATLLPQLVGRAGDEDLYRLVMSLAPDAGSQAILAARGNGLHSSELVDRLCDDLGSLLLDRKRIGPARRLLAASYSTDGVLATALLGKLEEGGRKVPLQVAVENQGITHVGLRRAVRRLALGHELVMLQTLADADALWETFHALFPWEDEQMRMKRMLGVDEMSPPGRAVAVILAWLAAVLFERNDDLLNRMGSLRDQDAEELAVHLASSVAPWQLEEVGPVVVGAPKRARKWWHRLEDRSFKAHPGSR